MIREFVHSGNEVTIGEVKLTLADFKLLFPDYSLPENAVGQLYEQNKCHRIFYKDGTHKDVGESWQEGDKYIVDQLSFSCQLESIKLHRNPTVVPTAEALLKLSVAKRKKKIESGPYSKINKAQFLAAVRKHRTNLLAACDWIMLPDSAVSEDKKAEWVQYRQKLRDLPVSKKDAFDIVFPSEPQ